MAMFHGFGVLPISNIIVELLQDCSLCLKEGNGEEEPVRSHLSLNYPLSLIRSERDCHAASLLVAGEFSWRNRGGGPPMEYAS